MNRADTVIPTTRLAPSPTGALHLGNARTFLINWALARQAGQRIVLRIEDLDGPRVKAAASEQAIDVLRWLGLDWDGEPIYQSADLTPYHQALERLHAKRLIYPCQCTRKEIQQAQSAPHGDEHELRYPGTCRPKQGEEGAEGFESQISGSESVDREVPWHDKAMLLEADETTAWRVCIPDEPITFDDALHGEVTVNVQQQVGDFIVATKQGLPAYQLAVVVDDARQGVTEVVRGGDLLRSTARQLWLYRMLDLTPGTPESPGSPGTSSISGSHAGPPRYIHLPLVLGPDGRRLAKRHGDTRLLRYRVAGVTAERVVGLLAWWSGITPRREEMSAQQFAEQFILDRLPREPITFTDEDHAWLASETPGTPGPLGTPGA